MATNRDRQRDAALEDEDESPKDAAQGVRRRFSEFECPACSANNPFDEFGNNDEVLCGWCGLQFQALVDEEGKLKLKEL
jgi:transcription elongation factor Elf1